MNTYTNTTHIPRRNVRVANRMIDSMIESLKTLHVMGSAEAYARNSLDNLVLLYEDYIFANDIADEAPNASFAITCTIEELWG